MRIVAGSGTGAGPPKSYWISSSIQGTGDGSPTSSAGTSRRVAVPPAPVIATGLAGNGGEKNEREPIVNGAVMTTGVS